MVFSTLYVYNIGFEKTFTPDLSVAFDIRGDKTLDVYQVSLNYKF
jgi:hypothetical protein